MGAKGTLGDWPGFRRGQRISDYQDVVQSLIDGPDSVVLNRMRAFADNATERACNGSNERQREIGLADLSRMRGICVGVAQTLIASSLTIRLSTAYSRTHLLEVSRAPMGYWQFPGLTRFSDPHQHAYMSAATGLWLNAAFEWWHQDEQYPQVRALAEVLEAQYREAYTYAGLDRHGNPKRINGPVKFGVPFPSALWWLTHALVDATNSARKIVNSVPTFALRDGRTVLQAVDTVTGLQRVAAGSGRYALEMASLSRATTAQVEKRRRGETRRGLDDPYVEMVGDGFQAKTRFPRERTWRLESLSCAGAVPQRGPLLDSFARERIAILNESRSRFRGDLNIDYDNEYLTGVVVALDIALLLAPDTLFRQLIDDNPRLLINHPRARRHSESVLEETPANDAITHLLQVVYPRNTTVELADGASPSSRSGNFDNRDISEDHGLASGYHTLEHIEAQELQIPPSFLRGVCQRIAELVRDVGVLNEYDEQVLPKVPSANNRFDDLEVAIDRFLTSLWVDRGVGTIALEDPRITSALQSLGCDSPLDLRKTPVATYLAMRQLHDMAIAARDDPGNQAKLSDALFPKMDVAPQSWQGLPRDQFIAGLVDDIIMVTTALSEKLRYQAAIALSPAQYVAERAFRSDARPIAQLETPEIQLSPETS